MATKKTSSNKKGARLGQHFLTAPSVAQNLVASAAIQAGDTVVEIGPGKGFLTKVLVQTGARIIAVEKDPALVESLADIFRTEVAEGQLTIIHADIRSLDPHILGLKDGEYSVAANIPYYITGEIIRMFLTARAQPHTMALLMQKEVAERIARSKKESLLSLSVKVYGTPRYVQTVRAGSFSPPPTVDSAILTISDISRKHFVTCTEEKFFAVIRAGFAAKRKLLASNVRPLAQKDAITKAFGACSIDTNARAEDISLPTWLCLSREL